MNVYSFPLCCGAKVITSFTGILPAGVELEIKRIIALDKTKMAFYSAILTDEQYKIHKDVMKKLKFKHLGTSVNGVHNSTLHFYLYKRPTTRKAKAKTPKGA